MHTSHQKTQRLTFKDYINKLPLHRVKQMHLCSYSNEFEDHIARDVHEPVQDYLWKEIKEVLPKLPLVEYATIEYYKDFEILKSQLKELRSFIRELS